MPDEAETLLKSYRGRTGEHASQQAPRASNKRKKGTPAPLGVDRKDAGRRGLWTQPKYSGCIQALIELQNEYPEEEEIPRLLQTAREDQAEQEKRQNLDKARNLLAARHYDECRSVLADLQKRFPTNEEISDLILELKADEEKQRKPLRFAEARDRARISPHVLVGFETNTNSITAGDLTTGTRGSIPNDFVYTAGADAKITNG